MTKHSIRVTRDGEQVGEILAESVQLDYPDMKGRGEVNMGRSRDGAIWACVTGGGPQRVFCSSDEGRTWQGRPIHFPDKMRAFTVLSDGTLLLAVVGGEFEEAHVFRSTDGKQWEGPARIPAAPYDRIGEGPSCMTQIADGTVLFPICRWMQQDLSTAESQSQNSIFRSTDGGKSWGDLSATFDFVGEVHILQLHSGKLLGAFRHQRPLLPDDPPDIVERWGAKPAGTVAGVPGQTPGGFKHVFVGDSEDNGRTWKDLRPLLTGEGRPLLAFGEAHGQVVQLRDGRVVLVHERRYPYEGYEVRARVSCDEGKTWAPELYHVSFGAGYPASVVLEDGTIVTVTGSTPFDAEAKPIGKHRAQAVRWRLPDR